MASHLSRHMMQLSPPSKKEDAEWRRIHEDKPTLASLTDVTFTTWASKKGRSGLLGTSWNRRYWALQGQFFCYFDSDSPSCKCGGAVYLNSARFDTVGADGDKQNVLRIRPTVPRRPGMPIDSDDNVWHLSFDSAADLDKALTTLRACGLARGELHRAPTATTYDK
eukprot:TRINITY_DN45572_c0_g1_i1.p2 TRINITY_DN45572_c0_g1~~TRINITY_DN45572_c0_g1_i1.p2  ORF type:complete len:166 (+),score=11.40 TRINITY_DN45572_c0_g1_i1:266-763(+)